MIMESAKFWMIRWSSDCCFSSAPPAILITPAPLLINIFLRHIVKLRLHVSTNTHFWAVQINIEIIAYNFAMRCKCEKGNWTRLRKIVRNCAKLCSMICVSSNTNYWGCWSILGKLDQQWREAVIVIHTGTSKATPTLFSLKCVYSMNARMPRDFFAQCNRVHCKMQFFTDWCNLQYNCNTIYHAVNKWAVAEVARLHWNNRRQCVTLRSLGADIGCDRV